MSSPAYIYQEPMTFSELSFLREKEQKERRTFFRTVRNMAVLMIIIPACGGILIESISRSNDTPELARWRAREEPYPYLYYLTGMGFLLLLLLVASYISYNRTLKQLLKDIRSGYKTIEKTEIDRKQFIAANRTYHFYLKSTFRLSIEVSKEDFELYREGDEINIEYSTRSRIYFGYF